MDRNNYETLRIRYLFIIIHLLTVVIDKNNYKTLQMINISIIIYFLTVVINKKNYKTLRIRNVFSRPPRLLRIQSAGSRLPNPDLIETSVSRHNGDLIKAPSSKTLSYDSVLMVRGLMITVVFFNSTWPR